MCARKYVISDNHQWNTPRECAPVTSHAPYAQLRSGNQHRLEYTRWWLKTGVELPSFGGANRTHDQGFIAQIGLLLLGQRFRIIFYEMKMC
jgi:hypothetical protein